jgi:hypothetical protein
LAESHDVGVGTIIEPSTLLDDLFAKIPQMGDRSPERGETQSNEDPKNFAPVPRSNVSGGSRRRP